MGHAVNGVQRAEEKLVEIDDLAGLWTRNDTREVGILAAFAVLFLAVRRALGTSPLFVLLFLFARAFSLAFIHAAHLRD